jgi:hypothetical protein
VGKWAVEDPDAAAAMFSWAEFVCLFVGLLVGLHRYKTFRAPLVAHISVKN